MIRDMFRRLPCDLSFVIVGYKMQREIERTLLSLSREYQIGTNGIRYEVIVIDNGSPTPLDLDAVGDIGVPVRLHRMENASVSPAAAINHGARMARGRFLAIMIDGARMLSPGVVHKAMAATRLARTPLISVLGLHLGPDHQKKSVEHGYSHEVEDRLLASVDWFRHGYRLFEISVWGGSSAHGWFGPIAESNCIILDRTLFRKLGGYDESFVLPGGGLVNLDFYKRAVESDGVQPIYLLGEGCFHQLHGGVTTGAKQNHHSFDQLNEEYRHLRGEKFSSPQVDPILFGNISPSIAPATLLAIQSLMESHGMPSVGARCQPYMKAR